MRGSVSGILIGILMSRTISGLGADTAGWRAIYALAAVAAVLFPIVLHLLGGGSAGGTGRPVDPHDPDVNGGPSGGRPLENEGVDGEATRPSTHDDIDDVAAMAADRRRDCEARITVGP